MIHHLNVSLPPTKSLINLSVSQRRALDFVLLVHSRKVFFELFSFAHISNSTIVSTFSSIFSCLQLRLIAMVLGLFLLAFARCISFQSSSRCFRCVRKAWSITWCLLLALFGFRLKSTSFVIVSLVWAKKKRIFWRFVSSHRSMIATYRRSPIAAMKESI